MPPPVQDEHPRSQAPRHPQVVGDQEKRDRPPPMDAAHQLDQLDLDRRIHPRHRLVRNHEPGPRGQGPRESDPAPLAPGERLRVLATDPHSVADFEAFSAHTGHRLIESRVDGDVFEFVLERRA